jgi:hypothetical protein
VTTATILTDNRQPAREMRRQQAGIEQRIAHVQRSIDTLAKAGLSWTRGFYNLQDKLADLQIQAHAAEVEMTADEIGASVARSVGMTFDPADDMEF